MIAGRMPAPRRLAAVLGAAIAALALPTAASAATSAQLRGLAPVLLHGRTDAGALPARQLHFTLALAPRNRASLARAARHHSLAARAAEFNSEFAPSQATVDAVRSWAKSNGLTVDSVSSNRLLVRLSGSSADVAGAFGTSLQRYRDASGSSYFTPSSTAKLPGSISWTWRPWWASRAWARSACLRSAHRATPRPPRGRRSRSRRLRPAGPLGALQRAVLGDRRGPVGGGHRRGRPHPAEEGPRDLRARSSACPHVPWNQIQVGPRRATPPATTSGTSTRSTRPASRRTSRPATSTTARRSPTTTSSPRSTAGSPTTRAARRSFSAGECEVLAQVTRLHRLARRGRSSRRPRRARRCSPRAATPARSARPWSASTACPPACPSVEYPAASPYAIGVGGTTVLGSGPTEVAWYAGGGGSSVFEPTPSWQANAGGSFLGVQPRRARTSPSTPTRSPATA